MISITHVEKMQRIADNKTAATKATIDREKSVVSAKKI